MYSLETIKHINFELTSFCNARCPQCQRFDMFGKLQKDLKPTNLELEVIRKLPIDKMIKLEEVSLIGNFGDPLMYPFLDQVLDFFSNKKIMISTNASLRNIKWWGNIAKKFPKLVITFCIDGLNDTHSLYRVGTSYEKILENAKSFINNGGNAQWQFIVFKHNEHQIDEAKKLAEKLKFKKIFFMYSDRFDTSDTFKVFDNENYLYDLKKSSTQITLRDKLKSPAGKKYWGNLYKLADKENIECIWAKNKQIYIHSDATVFPCCLVGCVKAGRQIENSIYKKIIKDWNNVNLYHNNFENIINGPYYNEYFKKSLEKKAHPICIENCNKITGKLFHKYLNKL